MLPYQIYQALIDQHVRDLRGDARRRELSAAARNTPPPATEHSSRLRDTTAHLLGLLHLRDGARHRPTTTTGAGPMGCVA